MRNLNQGIDNKFKKGGEIMKMFKVRWIVVIFVLLGILLIGTESQAIDPSPTRQRMDQNFVPAAISTICIKNYKNVILNEVRLLSVTTWFDGQEWHVDWRPIRTWQNFAPGRNVCVRVGSGYYRVNYIWGKYGEFTPIKFVAPKQTANFGLQ